MTLHPQDLTGFDATPLGASPPPAPPRRFSIWEITSWILPMAPEHLRRVLAAHPDLPQGQAGLEGATRWFSAADLATLRAHFASTSRRDRWQPRRPAGVQAPLITLAQPLGAVGRSRATLTLAVGAALAGWRVLVIEADPAGHLAETLAPDNGPEPVGDGVLSLLARDAALSLRRLNEGRFHRGEVPLPVDDLLARAQTLRPRDLIRPSRWPGLDLLAPGPDGLALADLRLGDWRQMQRGWQPWGVLAGALNDGLRDRYDLIFCDPGRGLGPLALSMLASADVLLSPLPQTGAAGLRQGLGQLGAAIEMIQSEARMTARALGQPAPDMGWRSLAVLAMGAGSPALPAGFAAKPGVHLLPAALPDSPGGASHLYDIDYRSLGRLAYAPLRAGTEAALAGLMAHLAGLWDQDVTLQGQFLLSST